MKALLFILFISFSLSGLQAKEAYKFRTLSPEGGFNYNGVKNIQQDNEGFMWILMDDEIYRFDGYTYKRYTPYFTWINPTKGWGFQSILVDTKGRLYVSTGEGLFQYNYISDEFVDILNGRINNIMVDNKDYLWIRENRYWGIFDTETKEINIPLYDGDSISYISNTYCMNNEDLYHFSNYGKIYRYNYSKNEFSLCSMLPHSDGRILGAKAYKGKLWILVEKYGLYKLDLITFAIENHYNFPEESKISQSRTFYMDKKGNFWFGTIHGIHVFNPETEEIHHYAHDESDPFSLPNSSIWTINEDRQGNIWIGTYSGAVCYVNLDEKNAFETYLPHKDQLNHTPVSTFAEDKNYIWVGTEGGGINRIDKKTNEFTYYTDANNSPRLAFNNIKSLVVDNKSNLWIGMYTGGIDCFNTKTGQITNFKNQKDRNSLRFNDIRKLVLENDSGIWITYQSHQLLVSYYSFETALFTHIDFSGKGENTYIFDILRGPENQLWLLTKERLFLMNVKNHEVKSFMPNDSVFMNLNTMCMDASGNLWIGTIGNGLLKYDPNTSKFTTYKEILQQNISSVFNICYDDDDNLWLGTDNGLICYNIKQGTFLRYDKADGVQGSVYYPLAAMKSLDGKLYFGGTNGFSIVNTKKISSNKYKPEVIISDFLIDHEPTIIDFSNSSGIKEITLEYNQSNFGFKFSSDNYLIPEKNQFKYRLKGYDDRWIEVNADNRAAMYSKVPSGTYNFEILAANNDGLWNDVPMVIKIRRKPAPWLSLPAYFGYIIIVLFVSFLIIRYYHAKKELELKLYLENVEKEKKEEIHQSQLRFFTNISHDFRTPLSLIIATLDKLRQEGLKEYYYRILSSNAQRLLNLVNELMDFRTIENGKMNLELQAANLSTLIQEFGADFIDYARQRNIDYQIICDPNIPQQLYVDKNILEKVVMNLLNNAFKYTKAGGKITLEIGLQPFVSDYENKFVVQGEHIPRQLFSIVVRDTGVGITEESIQSVFERFYKVNTINFDSHLGTGIGLALVKSLVLLHRGIISVYSERDKGTDIAVSFSIDKNIYEAENFIQEKSETCSEDTNIEKNNSENDKLEDDIAQVQRKSKKRILLVEDNEDLRQIIADFLFEDYEVIQAGDGVEASELLLEKVIDLIISDIMMPRKDGITFSRELKENVETSHIPLILLTAKTSLESKLEGADSGADIYFEKPIDLQLLKLSIQNVFKHQQQLRDYYAKNYYSDGAELSSNERDSKFMQDFVKIIEENLDHPDMDVNYIATKLSMSRSKLYRKIKTMTDKSIIEFILSYKLKKAARLIIEEDMTMRQIMDEIGIESQAYFTNAFKKEFGKTPTAFATEHKRKKTKR